MAGGRLETVSRDFTTTFLPAAPRAKPRQHWELAPEAVTLLEGAGARHGFQIPAASLSSEKARPGRSLGMTVTHTVTFRFEASPSVAAQVPVNIQNLLPAHICFSPVQRREQKDPAPRLFDKANKAKGLFRVVNPRAEWSASYGELATCQASAKHSRGPLPTK